MDLLGALQLYILANLLLWFVCLALEWNMPEIQAIGLSVSTLGHLVLTFAMLTFWVLTLRYFLITSLHDNAGLYRGVKVENAEAIGGYKPQSHCLMDWRGTFVAVGSLETSPIMRYTRYEGVTAECPTGTLVAVTEERIAQQRLTIAQAEAREERTQSLDGEDCAAMRQKTPALSWAPMAGTFCALMAQKI